MASNQTPARNRISRDNSRKELLTKRIRLLLLVAGLTPALWTVLPISTASAASSTNATCTAQWVSTQYFGNVGADTRQYAPHGGVAPFYGGFAHVQGYTADECFGLLIG